MYLFLLLLGSCTYEGVQRLREDLEGLRQRVHAREEVRIQVAGPTPRTTSGQVASPTEPHVTLGTPPCPPAASRVLPPALAPQPTTQSRGKRPRVLPKARR